MQACATASMSSSTSNPMKDRARVFELVREADGLIEGFRPGVIERLGLGPEVLLASQSPLVIGRMTGWGQDGPMASAAGHDINYIALSGALHAYGREGQKPTPPLNAVGDFGGGGMMLAFGMLAGILSAKSAGKGRWWTARWSMARRS
jgi:alpha-methylacyl-CoA racemase